MRDGEVSKLSSDDIPYYMDGFGYDCFRKEGEQEGGGTRIQNK